MNALTPNPTPEPIIKARIEADKLARLLSEELPDGDEIKDSLYAVSMAIRKALPAIRELEGKSPLHHAALNECLASANRSFSTFSTLGKRGTRND